MIQGRKPNGYFTTRGGADGMGAKIERETRQCVHCQFSWEYDPYKEADARTIRGFCLNCYGFTCQRPECHAQQKLMLSEYPDRTRPCISFYEHYQRRLEKINKSIHFEVTPSGLIVPKDPFTDIPGLEGLIRL